MWWTLIKVITSENTRIKIGNDCGIAIWENSCGAGWKKVKVQGSCILRKCSMKKQKAGVFGITPCSLTWEKEEGSNLTREPFPFQVFMLFEFECEQNVWVSSCFCLNFFFSKTVSPVFAMLHDFGQAPGKSQQAFLSSELTRRKAKSWSEASRNGITPRSPSGNSTTVSSVFTLLYDFGQAPDKS